MVLVHHLLLLFVLGVSAGNEPSSSNDVIIIPRSLFGTSLQGYRNNKRAIWKSIGRQSQNPREVWSKVVATQRTQPQLPPSAKFPCQTSSGRSPTRPTSVHKLRPGDIDVIAAMGDSITAGNGILSVRAVELLLEDRAASYIGGILSNWRTALTLPTILKEFNKNLIGYANDTSMSIDHSSQFNVAEPMAFTKDMVHQAKVLVHRLQLDPRVNFTEDWKMVSIMVGANDACHLFYENTNDTVERHRRALTSALDFLEQSMVRTFINLIVVPDVSQIAADKEQRSLICSLMRLMECPVVFSPRFFHRRQELKEIIRKTQIAQIEVGSLEKYRKRDDFVVAILPWAMVLDLTVNKNPKLTSLSATLKSPVQSDRKTRNNTRRDLNDKSGHLQSLAVGRRPDERVDITLFAQDCFHFSQKTHARASNALWNNLLEPEGNKSVGWLPTFRRFLCPTSERPYLSTWANSQSYNQYQKIL